MNDLYEYRIFYLRKPQSGKFQ